MTDPSSMVSLAHARRTILSAVRPIGGESIPLQSARGRRLLEDLRAPWALPVADHSAMDGYALAAGDAPELGLAAVVGRSEPGAPFEGRLPTGTAVRILTGATIPAGSDRVVRQEDVECVDDAIQISAVPGPGANIRKQGEDVLAGVRVLEAGSRLDPPRIAVLAAFGQDPVAVRRRPRVVVVTCGNELVPPSQAREDRVVDSAGPMLAAACEELGAIVERPPLAPDDLPQLERTLAAAVACAPDAIITIGAASVGDRDHMRPALANLGCSLTVQSVAVKPGKPTAFGGIEDIPVFVLPGNPNAAYTIFELLVAPALLRIQGSPEPSTENQAILEHDVRWSGTRTLAQRAVVTADATGLRVTIPSQWQGSNRLAAVCETNGIAVLPPATGLRPAGSSVSVYLTRGQISPPPHPAVAAAASTSSD